MCSVMLVSVTTWVPSDCTNAVNINPWFFQSHSDLFQLVPLLVRFFTEFCIGLVEESISKLEGSEIILDGIQILLLHVWFRECGSHRALNPFKHCQDNVINADIMQILCLVRGKLWTLNHKYAWNLARHSVTNTIIWYSMCDPMAFIYTYWTHVFCGNSEVVYIMAVSRILICRLYIQPVTVIIKESLVTAKAHS